MKKVTSPEFCVYSQSLYEGYYRTPIIDCLVSRLYDVKKYNQKNNLSLEIFVFKGFEKNPLGKISEDELKRLNELQQENYSNTLFEINFL